MATFILRRLLALIPLLLLISFVVYALVLIVPGDPSYTLAGGTKADPATIIRIRHQLHLDESFLSQYWRWFTHAIQGDLGHPLFNRGTVAENIWQRFPITLSLALGAMVVSFLIGIPAGILSAIRPGTWLDRLVTLGSSTGIAMPDFWVAMILVSFFAVSNNILPSLGWVPISESLWGWFEHLILPCVALGLAGGATLARQLRGSLIDVLDQDYIRSARAMGLREREIIGKLALKNAAAAPLTIAGIQFAYLLGGTFIIENIFSMPGLGSYLLSATGSKDLPVIQGGVLVVALIFVLVNLAVDIGYAYLNPKVQLQ
ncbi:MAG: ABC transporter permease [Acidimicrobiia bacterium]|nr:ABC transporter permease [Acidimicrobiia bacterium]